MLKTGFIFPLFLLLLLSSCSSNRGIVPTPLATQLWESSPTATQDIPSPQITGSTAPTAVLPVPTNVRVEDPQEYVFAQLLPFDAIRPVYDPEFVLTNEATLLNDELVMGVVLGGQAKAYPVSVLRFREMVDDELAGWPILVTW